MNRTLSVVAGPGSVTGGCAGGVSASSSSPPQPANALVASNMAHHLLQSIAFMLVFSFQEQFPLRT
jgi:hypothetical protein